MRASKIPFLIGLAIEAVALVRAAKLKGRA